MPTESAIEAPRRPRRFRLRWVVALLLIAAGVTIGLAYRHYTSPERIRALAETYLQRYVRGPVTVGAAGFSWRRGVRLFDVTVMEPPGSTMDAGVFGNAGGAEPVFSCPEIRLVHDSFAALWGELRIRSITAVSPSCLIARDTVSGNTNVTGLLLVSETPDTGGSTVWPRVELKDARVRVVSRDRGSDRPVEDLTLTVRALPTRNDPHVYDIVWQGGEGRVASGQSQIDLHTGALRNVRDGLPWMSIEAVMLVINAGYDGVGAWSDLLGLDGTVRARDYQLQPDSADEDLRSATIELSNAAISIPVSDEEQREAPEDRYLRFDQVRGHVQLTGREIRAAFTGLLHGAECDVSMTLRAATDELSTLDDVDFDARLSVHSLVLPRPDPEASVEQARFVGRWPQLARFYRDYDPRGVVDLDIAVSKRAGADQPVNVRRLELTAKSGDGLCRFFPYRLYDVEGSVTYTEEGIFVRGLRGRHGEATVLIDAWVDKPTRWSKKTVSIKGTDVAIDQDLRSSLSARYRKLCDQFSPTGTVDVDVNLVQPETQPGSPIRWRSACSLALKGVSGIYKGFPYRVEKVTGTLNFSPGRAEVVGLTGRAGAADVEIDGVASFESGRLVDLDLTVRAENAEFDDHLRLALPSHARSWWDVVQPSGRFDAQTRLTLDAESRRVAHTSDVRLKGASGKHEAFPLPVKDVLGRLVITPNEILIEGVTGRCSGATISLDGAIATGGPTARTSLTIRTRDLRLDEAFRSSLPRQYYDALAGWTIDGPIATETIITTHDEVGGHATKVHTTARLDGVTVSHDRLAQPLADVQAAITIDDAGIRSEQMQATYGPATLGIGIDLRRSDTGEEGTLTLTATGVPLDEASRGLWPKRFSTFWDRLEPAGTMNLHVTELRYARSSADAPLTWWVDGYAELHQVSLGRVADLRRVSGTLRGRGALVDRLGGVSLKGDMSLARADVLGQPLQQTEGTWSFVRTAGGEGMIHLEGLRGYLHAGSLTGGVDITFGPQQTEYDVSVSVQNMQMEPFVNVDRKVREPGSEPIDVRGRADAQLCLSGIAGRPSSARGSGRMEIHEAHVYRLPIMLAILHVLNLSMPDDNAFDDAQVDFLISGRRVHAEAIRLHGSVLALVGSGTMSLPDRGLDLSLVHVSPRSWTRVPLLTDVFEGASRELVELQVTGPLSQPSVRTRPLRGITDEFKSLFQKRKPKKTEPPPPGRS